ncbi:recombinase family protein [Deinococcus sp. 6YEL10]|uniref:recombinase family protein n=1 Tax=Deinococcus sp. 6YEL10 TaxID=2745870 RepID=UPI001E4BAEEC|nr:recombinase family protein [Deinococcus sp. 6YEL10]MCD0162715.1 recombinase family protein [Deinococcus sp. 6YEL10]
MLIGYARSAQDNKQPLTQIRELLAAGCQAVYIDQNSGDHLERPTLHRAIESLRPGDTLVTQNGDRLSRNPAQTAILLGRVAAQGADVRFLHTTPRQPPT